jgi:hypothetical protein
LFGKNTSAKTLFTLQTGIVQFIFNSFALTGTRVETVNQNQLDKYFYLGFYAEAPGKPAPSNGRGLLDIIDG